MRALDLTRSCVSNEERVPATSGERPPWRPNQDSTRSRVSDKERVQASSREKAALATEPGLDPQSRSDKERVPAPSMTDGRSGGQAVGLEPGLDPQSRQRQGTSPSALKRKAAQRRLFHEGAGTRTQNLQIKSLVLYH